MGFSSNLAAAPFQGMEETVCHDGRGGGGLFGLLPLDLFLILVRFISNKDPKSLVLLASCDKCLQTAIFKKFTFLWTHIDLATFPGITDQQLQALLERINARTTTKSLILDKTTLSPITGVGLVSLINSKVLESIDLRQSDSIDLGPTGLDDSRVAEVLSTMIPYKLDTVKVRKQYPSYVFPFDEYCFPFGALLTNLHLAKARRGVNQRCSFCSVALEPHCLTTHTVMNSASIQCTACNSYTCKAWRNSSACPAIMECNFCLETTCPCEPVIVCHDCGLNSCTKCDKVWKCEGCIETECAGDGNVQKCTHCGSKWCNDCCFWGHCEICHSWFCCLSCSDIWTEICDVCEKEVCETCRDKKDGERPILFCWQCNAVLCRDCNKRGGRQIITPCELCNRVLCIKCSDSDYYYEECDYCSVVYCKDCDEQQAKHDCKQPGELVYSAREAREGDDRASLCACGKKHLSSTKGQQFICAWIQS